VILRQGSVTLNEAVSTDELRRQLTEVRESRARVAAAADAERRRIERGLHDGVQQDLIALSVNLQWARELADSNPLETRSLLDQLARDVHETLDHVRRLAQGVYPSLLHDRGLAEALRSAAWSARVPTQVEAASDRYSAELEAAVYFSCVQALEAVEPSGSDARATVRVWSEGGSLLLEVVVEGDGVEQTSAALSGVEDRVGAVAGTLDISSEPARLRLLGTIPLEA
jgi:signal transduction histidine kinase